MTASDANRRVRDVAEVPAKSHARKNVQHIEYAIPPDGNGPIYQWHKYWGRKPHNVVRQFIEAYAPSGGVVVDPFVGSGVTAIEALLSGRRAVVCDLNPISADIIRATVAPPRKADFENLAMRFRNAAAGKAQNLYDHICARCGKTCSLMATALAITPVTRPTEFRYRCSCTDELIREKASGHDYFASHALRLHKEAVWWPDHELAYPDGRPFQKRERYVRYRDLFTPRNLLALSYMWQAIVEGNWKTRERDLLATLFRSIVHLCSRVSGDRRVRPTAAGWTQHSFWYATFPVEINAWGAMDRKLTEYLAVIDDWHSRRPRPVRIGKTPEEVFAGDADLYVASQDCATFLRNISRSNWRADYVFTDPPYNGMIQYGELSAMWNAWRSDDEYRRYIAALAASELTENKGQSKTLQEYYQHLRAALYNLSESVTPGSYIHLTFSSPKIRYRNLTLRAARLAGLDFQKLHFQQSARVSKKAIDQPFGSVFGDFIFRFHKTKTRAKRAPRSNRDLSFSAIISERSAYILKHRSEPTHISLLVAECERELFRSGFFDDDEAIRSDAEKQIRSHDRFVVDGKGLVAFSDVREFEGTPLSMRVEKTVREMLAANRVVTYTDVWSALLREYPNSLTPDSASLSKALLTFAVPKEGGLWEARAAVTREKSSLHNRAIAAVCKAMIRHKFSVTIGKPEAGDGNLVHLSRRCSDFTRWLIGSARGSKQPLSDEAKRRTQNIDLVAWRDDQALVVPIYCFEVETSTNFIDAFERFEPVAKLPFLDSLLVLLVGERIDELRGKIARKMTFRMVPDDLKKRARIVSFTAEDLESMSWPILQKLIETAPSWYALEHSKTASKSS
jgi:16S rRNA G966 N2-methylase RsmD